MSDRGLRDFTDIPVDSEIVEGFGTGEIAAAVTGFESERAAQSIELFILYKAVDSELQSCFIEGDVAGIKSVTFSISGDNAYGYLLYQFLNVSVYLNFIFLDYL